MVTAGSLFGSFLLMTGSTSLFGSRADVTPLEVVAEDVGKGLLVGDGAGDFFTGFWIEDDAIAAVELCTLGSETTRAGGGAVLGLVADAEDTDAA